MSISTVLHRKPWLVAAAFVVLLIVWMLSGVLTASEPQTDAATKDVLSKNQLTSVRAESRVAKRVAKEVALHGRTEASREATLTVETSGRVEAILVNRGEYVEKGQLLIKLAMNERQHKLEQAEALLKQRELEYKGSQKLNHRGFNAEAKLAEAKQLMESARAELERQKLDIQYTQIRAPFSGVFNERRVELGDYVSVGQQIGVVLDIDPVIVRVDVPELDMAKVHLNQIGEAKLITGEHYSGKVRYVSKQSSDATHTFRVELAIDNPTQEIPVGISSTVSLISDSSLAHKISPALLSLSDSGALGVKIVDSDNQVHFRSVDVVKTESDGIWIAGLPDEVNLITVGQGFVRDGDEVTVDLIDKRHGEAIVDADEIQDDTVARVH